jgi:hypothetical protein
MARGGVDLMETFTPFHDGETITTSMLARVEMVAGMSTLPDGTGDPAAAPT